MTTVTGVSAMGVDKDGYYTLRDILGYNCKVNIVLSDRGRGKSYGTKLFLMRQEGDRKSTRLNSSHS